MFWNKKEDKNSLPDLPASPSGFTMPSKNNPSQASQSKNNADDFSSSLIQSPSVSSKQNSFSHNSDEDDDSDMFPAEKHALPSFPDSPMKKGFSQAAIKDAISTEKDDSDNLDLPDFQPSMAAHEDRKDTYPVSDRNFKTIEMDEDHISAPVMHDNVSIVSPTIIAPPPKKSQKNYQTYEDTKMPDLKAQDSSIFVKIDKFRSARRSLEEIKLRIEEIDELLKKIRETKLREDQELTAWEKEITTLKSRIQNVTENIFEKVE